MKIWIIITQKNPELVWNAFRFANFSIKQKDRVSIFLLWEWVEYETNSSDKFDIKKQVEEFLNYDDSEILACWSCIKLRNQESSETCPISTMLDLYKLVNESDKVLTF